jgi:hypothetical protein
VMIAIAYWKEDVRNIKGVAILEKTLKGGN